MHDPAHHPVVYLLVPCAMFHAAAGTPFCLFRAFAAARIRRHHETVPCGPPTDAWETQHPRRREETVSRAGYASTKSASRSPPGPRVPGAPGPRAPGDPWRVPPEGVRQGAPQARSSAHPARGPPRALAVPGLTFGALSSLASCCGCSAAGGRREEGKDSEWRSPRSRVPIPGPTPPQPPPALARTSPCLD